MEYFVVLSFRRDEVSVLSHQPTKEKKNKSSRTMKNIDSMRPPRQKRSSSDPSSLAFIVHGLNDSKEEDPSFSDKDSSGPHSKGKQRPRCTAPGCTKTVKSRGKCNSHGGGHRCSEADCLNFAVSHGKCISHGVCILSTGLIPYYYNSIDHCID